MFEGIVFLSVAHSVFFVNNLLEVVFSTNK